jgi:hypothetical protein
MLRKTETLCKGGRLNFGSGNARGSLPGQQKRWPIAGTFIFCVSQNILNADIIPPETITNPPIRACLIPGKMQVHLPNRRFDDGFQGLFSLVTLFKGAYMVARLSLLSTEKGGNTA